MVIMDEYIMNVNCCPHSEHKKVTLLSKLFKKCVICKKRKLFSTTVKCSGCQGQIHGKCIKKLLMLPVRQNRNKVSRQLEINKKKISGGDKNVVDVVLEKSIERKNKIQIHDIVSDIVNNAISTAINKKSIFTIKTINDDFLWTQEDKDYYLKSTIMDVVKLKGQMIGSLSVGQLLVLRKLALLKLTAIMGQYCPQLTHSNNRTGWNWKLPKLMSKTKIPDPKDKTVFGISLITNVQKNGSALPPIILSAFRWLEDNALDHVGLFRKSGVKSQIQSLKQLVEVDPINVKFEIHQIYDVADMVKQYFRELPEVLLTNKLSESFIAIFQHVPVYLQKEAVHCTVLLLPDEHREALFALLNFLSRVSSKCDVNQMSASNLAVCWAPSLFHLGSTSLHGSTVSTPSSTVTTQRSSSVSPCRNQSSTIGFPYLKQLEQNKAAHDCLLFLIKHYRELFIMSEDIINQCYMNDEKEKAVDPDKVKMNV